MPNWHSCHQAPKQDTPEVNSASISAFFWGDGGGTNNIPQFALSPLRLLHWPFPVIIILPWPILGNLKTKWSSRNF